LRPLQRLFVAGNSASWHQYASASLSLTLPCIVRTRHTPLTEGLKKFKCLAGNYGGAWYKQKLEFAHFPGPVLMSTNCIMPPLSSYSDRIFTTGEVGVAGSPHIGTAKDFSPLIAKALEMPGFTEEPAEPKFVTTGFAHNATLGAAGLVLDAIKVGGTWVWDN
jgi:hydroxylamine reductase